MMVLVIDDWEAFKVQMEATRGIGLYQVIGHGDGVTLRVRAGTIGYIEKFLDDEDKDLAAKQRVLEAYGFMRVVKSVADDAFFI
ncbi:MAG: hypothetical protein ACE5Z5_12880 [Candidatus Bathyarchaeia archaeon]